MRTEFGHVVRTLGDYGFFAYLPSAIPREIELDSRTVLLLSDADDALGRLAGVGRLLPNPHLLASA
ncbi:MAG: Fic family protein, partial [Actinomycetota bacterium]|nr:Fic family protein [Actinomycetota bacterium]